MTLRVVFPSFIVVSLYLSGCATTGVKGPHNALTLSAEKSLKKARSQRYDLEDRAGYYLDAAEQAASTFGQRTSPEATVPTDRTAQEIYNIASAELATLLRTSGIQSHAPGGFLIPHPEDPNRPPFRLKWVKTQPEKGLWAPDYFTVFKSPRKLSYKGIRNHFTQPGFGGPLVGVRRPVLEGKRPELFAMNAGVAGPVTAVLDFKPKKEVSLALVDPTARTTVPLHGKPRPVAADFTAPIAYYPRYSEFWLGLKGMIDVEQFIAETGLYRVSPYHRDRIPIIFVHGLASTPQMWVNVINDIEGDPQLRGRYQYWTFLYSTGAPMVYSATRLRDNLNAIKEVYPVDHDYVFISHSMGGLVSRMQVTTSGRVIWDRVFKENADRVYNKMPAENLLKRSLIVQADPDIDRIIFICTPHRGSELAISSLGDLATRLISIPASFVKGIEGALGGSLELLTKKNRVPTGIQSLSPRNSVLLALNTLPIETRYHSIIGDRGRGDTPNSSDGVVPYWSSHVDGAESEKIVPGNHSSYDIPPTIEEIRRILLLQLHQPESKKQVQRKKELANPPR